MSEGLNQILDHSGCLSEEQLLAYLRGGLSDEDRHAVELHLADCAFCSEAMEGLAAMEDRDMVPLVVKQIQQQLHHELQAHQLKHKKLKTYIWLSAAVVALLLILLFAYFVVNQRMREERQPSSPPAHTHVQAGRSRGTTHLSLPCRSMKPWLLLILMIASSKVVPAQGPASPWGQSPRDLPDTLVPSRLLIVGAGSLAVYGGSLALLNQYWYRSYPRSKFHVFNDDAEWMQMDKAGHAFTAYAMGKYATDVWQWTGLPYRRSVWVGGLSGLGYQTVIELLDAYSSEWGFSWGDMGANALGTAMFITEEFLWKEQRVLMKVSAHTVHHDGDPVLDEQTRALFGDAWLEGLLKDYNGQTYWMSANLRSFFPTSSLPSWLNLSVGLGAEHMYAGRRNLWTSADGQLHDYRHVKRLRQFYFAPDIDLTRIHTRKKGIRILLQVLNMIKIPAPTLELDSRGRWQVHALYF